MALTAGLNIVGKLTIFTFKVYELNIFCFSERRGAIRLLAS
jgi:hypothetical protein